MRRSRQSDRDGVARDPRAFTLIELILVLALLAIAATFVAASIGGFFRGRALNFEARRMLSLTHYGQSRAVAEGVPVVLWVNTTNSTYGVAVLSSFNDTDGDDRAMTYAADPSIALETSVPDATVVSEQDDEKLGLPEDMTAIRFDPDGFIDDSSVEKITLRQNTGHALELVPTENRLAYEIRPVADAN